MAIFLARLEKLVARLLQFFEAFFQLLDPARPHEPNGVILPESSWSFYFCASDLLIAANSPRRAATLPLRLPSG